MFGSGLLAKRHCPGWDDLQNIGYDLSKILRTIIDIETPGVFVSVDSRTINVRFCTS